MNCEICIILQFYFKAFSSFPIFSIVSFMLTITFSFIMADFLKDCNLNQLFTISSLTTNLPQQLHLELLAQ